MSNFMEFLVQMGQDAQLRHATNNELEQALIRAQVEPAQREAVLAGDRRRLEALLGATANTFCGVVVPEGDEDVEPALNHAAASHQAAVV